MTKLLKWDFQRDEVLKSNPLEYLSWDAQSCLLLDFGVQLIPRAVREFMGILTIMCRERKAFSFSDFSFCRLFDLNSKISSVSCHASLDKKRKKTGKLLFQVDCFTLNRSQITFISAMLFLGNILFSKLINLSEIIYIWKLYADLSGFWSKFSF